MPAKRTSIGHGVYRDENGTFWVRPWVDGRRTWRKLDAKTQKYAIEEARAKQTDHARSKQGTVKSPYGTESATFRELAETYLARKCPNQRLEPRPESFVTVERQRIETLREYFGSFPITSIRLPKLPDYAAWRRARIRKKGCSGDRAIDLELCTLSNVLRFGVLAGELDYNPIATGRPRYQTASNVKRSRERAVASGDDIHRIADYFFQSPRSEAMGWLVIFSALTGCRNVELRGLRVDGQSPNDPGYIEGNHLFLRRAKKGYHPFVEIRGPLAVAIECFNLWHAERFPAGTRHASPWWFPGGRDKNKPIIKNAFTKALYRACDELELPRCSAHGFRSYYVTLRRSEGASDIQIASEIGDKTVAVISQSYGDVPPNWVGQVKLSFLPKEGLPAWERWRPKEQKIVSL